MSFVPSRLNKDQRGITGLETAIVLVAFILVATVFAFAILTLGLVSAEKSTETSLGTLKEASSTLMVRGRVVGTSNSDLTALEQVKFTMSSATQANEGVEVDTSTTIITYMDEHQARNLAASDWTSTWLIGSGPLLDAGEQVEIAVSLSGLILPPGKGTAFTLRFRGANGAVVFLQKATPEDLTKVVELTSSGGSETAVVNDALEFDTLKGKSPNIIPITSIVYAIAYEGDPDDGFLKTVVIAPNGQITDTVIDTLEFDTVKGKDPYLISISGNVYAIAYSDTDDYGVITTVTIATNGQITDTVNDTLTFDSVKGKKPNMIPISGDVYAIAYEGDPDDGFLKTVTIATNGQITDTVIDTLEFDTVKGKSPNILPISGNTYAIAYSGDGDDGFLKTVTIAADGQITDTVIDTLEFDTVKGKDPYLISISGNVYAIAYSDTNDYGVIKTVTIATNGQITGTVIDTLTFDSVKGKKPNMIHISGDVYAIAYEGDPDDGFLKTVTIATNGQITDTVIDTLEFDTVKGKDANIIPVSGNAYAIAYSGDTDDGFLTSIEIADNGQIP